MLGGPPLVAELRFDPPRLWRFDRAHAEAKVAIECEGGVWSGGAHTRGRGYTEDCQKYNRAAALGWRVFRLTINMLREDPVGNLTPIKNAIEGETG
ncbi:MAG: hypothetical protein KGL39_05680 [Patescibacteria group bacterium]|nr:hypothetical protein [Patescibacteria group bacterium]